MNIEDIITELKNYVDNSEPYDQDQVRVNYLFVEKTIQDLLSKYQQYDLEPIAKEALTLVVWNYTGTEEELRDIWRESLDPLLDQFMNDMDQIVLDIESHYDSCDSWHLEQLKDRTIANSNEVVQRIERMISSPTFVQRADVWRINNVIEDLEDIDLYDPSRAS